MPNKIVWIVLALLILPVIALAVIPLPSYQLVNYAPSTTVVWPSGTSGDNSSGSLSVMLPASQPQELQFASGGSGSYNYWVGGESFSSAVLPNTGIQANIQVVSTEVTGCLSYWVAETATSGVWGQVGYYICNGSTPVGFYQIWKSGAVLVTGTTSVSPGVHTFSMYSVGNGMWAFAMDGALIGTYNMGASIANCTFAFSDGSCANNPVEVLSEEGYVNGPWSPPQVEFSQIQVQKLGVWASVPSTYEPYSCSSSDLDSCWGVQGNLQNHLIPDSALVTGGTVPAVPSGTTLWNGVSGTTTTTSIASTTSTHSTATSSTSYSISSSSSSSSLTSTSTLVSSSTSSSTTSSSSTASSTSSRSSTSTSTAASTSTSSTSSSTTTASSTKSTLSTSSASTSSTSSASTSSQSTSLQASLVISPSSVTTKSSVYFTVQVTDSHGNPVGGVGVTLTVTGPNGKSIGATGATDNTGLVYFQFKLNPSYPTGTYSVVALAGVALHGKSGGNPGATVSGSFVVN
jgi:hypothetical protein